MNVLYIGIENPISFAVENTKCSELTMVVENGSAKRTGECEYSVMVTKPGKSFIFIIKGYDTISKTAFRVKKIPNPVADSREQDFYQLDSLRAQNCLRVTMRYFDFDTSLYTVASFDIMIVRNRKLRGTKRIYCHECFKKIEHGYTEVIFSEKNEGPDFSDRLKAFIQHKLMPGDRVFIESIKAIGRDGPMRTLNSLIFTVQ